MLLCIFVSTGGVGKSVDQPYRQRLVPKWLVLGGEDTNRVVGGFVLTRKDTSRTTCRSVVGREVTRVMVG